MIFTRVTAKIQVTLLRGSTLQVENTTCEDHGQSLRNGANGNNVPCQLSPFAHSPQLQFWGALIDPHLKTSSESPASLAYDTDVRNLGQMAQPAARWQAQTTTEGAAGMLLSHERTRLEKDGEAQIYGFG
jgi:hypothetical protein